MNNENFINLVKTNTCFKGKGILYWSDIDELEVFFQEHLVWWRQHLKKKSLKFLIYQDYKKFALSNFKFQLLSKLTILWK